MPFAVLVTQHDKGKLIAPALAKLGVRVVENSNWNTDQLGTFAGEIERTLSPHACALEKAKQAIALTGLDIGLGSEGSFGGGPLPGIVNWNEEILCYYEPKHNRTIYAAASGPFPYESVVLNNSEALDQLTTPSAEGMHWIVNIGDELLKGLNLTMLKEAIALGERYSLRVWPLTVEPDLRALYCPPRQRMITKAAEDLARRLQALCPECEAPNFVVKQINKGLPCEQCSLPTEQALSETVCCDACGFSRSERVAHNAANPQYCRWCNP
ncbi:DUF6671 family protein [Aliidiomarina celeris]|uniref:DUF6671 family protein n=1 Tax=Aliidiomarina celeris TaxID=2249428 RepID=UPI000DEBF0E4|nr:DUF6671 family protein [Aliidiomarina celeris]